MSALLDNGQLKSVIMNCSFSTEEFSCSEGGVGSAILPLLACKGDMTSHLVNLGISGKRRRGRSQRIGTDSSSHASAKLSLVGGFPLDSLAKSGFPSLHMQDSVAKSGFRLT